MWHLHDDFRSFSFHAVEMEGSTQHFDTVVHWRDTDAKLFRFRVEANAVIFDADGVESDPLTALTDDYGFFCLGVFDYVGKGFLYQSVEIQLYGFIEIRQRIYQVQAAGKIVDDLYS